MLKLDANVQRIIVRTKQEKSTYNVKADLFDQFIIGVNSKQDFIQITESLYLSFDSIKEIELLSSLESEVTLSNL
jgi:hypothetical protein